MTLGTCQVGVIVPISKANWQRRKKKFLVGDHITTVHRFFSIISYSAGAIRSGSSKSMKNPATLSPLLAAAPDEHLFLLEMRAFSITYNTIIMITLYRHRRSLSEAPRRRQLGHIPAKISVLYAAQGNLGMSGICFTAHALMAREILMTRV
jgi:hypothetical protein